MPPDCRLVICAGNTASAQRRSSPGHKPAKWPLPVKSPLDVMIKNMLFWDQDAAALAEKLTAFFSGEADPDRRRELLKSIEPLPTAHERSQRCALDAVRYVHPKLEEIAWANSNFQSYHSRAGSSPVDTRNGSRLGGL